MTAHQLEPRQIINSIALFATGGAAAYTGLYRYGLGEIFHLGAGAFPFLLGLLLVLLSVLNLFSTFDPPPAPTRRQWFGALTVFAAIAVFAISLETLGLVPAVILLTMISRLAEPPVESARTLALAAGLSILAYIVFVLGLRMPLEAVNLNWS